jgi:uncharacterized protein YeeX (DUF496 family)
MKMKDARIKYHCHVKNIGAVANFNFGMKNVNTPFFSLLSDDSTLSPFFFEDAIKAIQSFPIASIIAGQTLRISEKGERLMGSLDRWESGLIQPPDGLLCIMEKGIPNWEGVLFRREILDTIGYLKPEFDAAIDQDFMMRIARSYPIYVTKNVYAYFLMHDNSWSNRRDLEQRIMIYKNILKQWLEDEGLSVDVKKRIKEKWKRYINKRIPDFVYYNCVVERKPEEINKAIKLMKDEGGFSYRSVRAIIAGKLACQSELSRKIILKIFNTYVNIKMRYHNRRRKNAVHHQS